MSRNEQNITVEFEAYGVRIGVFCDGSVARENIINAVETAVPNDLQFKKNIKHDHIFRLERETGQEKITVTKNVVGESFSFSDEGLLLDYLSSRLRITIAEFAGSKVFIHAGAVGWKGEAIIIPGRSYSGKTTLVSELIKNGAEYYSDEYAVLDEDGFLHPYPKMLSMRGIINDWDQVDTAPEKFGATVGLQPIPVKMILITEYSADAVWQPEPLSPGEAVMEILRHTIPIRHKPEFVLKVLKKTVSRAIIAKSERGAAQNFAPFFLEYLETTLN